MSTSSRKLRIEMVLPVLHRAGMENVTAVLARGLAARGHEVGFTCIEGPGDLGLDLRQEGFRVAVVAAPGLRPNVLPWEFKRWFRKVAPDVVHAHSGIWLKAAQGARWARVPRVTFTLHGISPSEPWYMRHYSRMAARSTDDVVAVSASLGEHLRNVVHVARDRVHVIPNGVSTREFCTGPRSPEFRRHLGIPADASVVGSVARLHPVKNHALLIAAFARLRQQRPDAFLLLVGDGPCRQEIERDVADRGLSTAVHITGVISPTAPLFREMDVFVLSSHIEGTSISALEAMASGVPVVATAVGGNPVLLGHGQRGLLAPAGDAAALMEAMNTLLQDETLRVRVTAAAAEAVSREYSEENMVTRYELLYGR
jgi:glycosyltransferase involved in cell wall biosynthesis